MLTPNTLLEDRYLIRKRLGSGNFSTVYLATDHRLAGRDVAVKEFNPASFPPEDQEWARATIRQEAEIRATLPGHPGMAGVVDYFQAGGLDYLVMEYVPGETLQEALERQPGGRFGEQQVLLWAGQLAAVLRFLHSHDPPIIFRDLKPGNVMVRPDGQLTLIDFGIARFHKPGQPGDTIALGTPGYAAPEQYGRDQSDPRTDVYALGVLLHQLLSGVDPAQYVMTLPPLAQANPAVSTHVAAAIDQATRPNRAERFASIEAFAAALGIPLTGPFQTPAAPVPAPPTVKLEEEGRRPWPRWLLAVGAAALLLGIPLFLLFGREPEPEATPTSQPVVLVTATARPTQTAEPATEVVEEVAVADLPAAATETPPTETPSPLPGDTPEPTLIPSPTEPPALPASISGEDGKQMLLVPAGPFLMGSTGEQVQNAVGLCRDSVDTSSCAFDEFANEMPQRTVTLSAFYMDVTEVSNDEYRACVTAGGCAAPSGGAGRYQPAGYYSNPSFGDYPVVWVSWHDARAYCLWAGKQLPTEAQWEKAARGEEGWVFPWGDTFECQRANTQECGGDVLQPVGSHPNGASPYGLLDMAGSVWEWVEDSFVANYYANARDEDPPPASGGGEKVLRGGSYSNFRHYARTSNRGYEAAGTASAYRGFRCASTPAP